MLYMGLCMTEHVESHIAEFSHRCWNPSHEPNQKFTKGPRRKFPTQVRTGETKTTTGNRKQNLIDSFQRQFKESSPEVLFLSFNFTIGLFIIAPSPPEFKDAWNTFLKGKGSTLYFTVKLQSLFNILSRIETALLKKMNCQCNEGWNAIGNWLDKRIIPVNE